MNYHSKPAAFLVVLSIAASLFVLADHRVAGAEDKKSDATSDKTVYDYSSYATTLNKYVDDDGMVDYKALKANRRPLDRFVRSLARLDRKEYESWDKKAQIAFWTNAYNAKTYAPENAFDDLSRKNAAVLNYLKNHMSKKDRRYLLRGDYSVYYLDYDWSLNEQE